MKLFVKLSAALSTLVLLILILFSIKGSENIEFLAKYEMLSCEDCDHMIVIDSTKKSLIGQSIVFISNKDIAEKAIDFSLSNQKLPTCVIGKLYYIEYTFGLINPKGRRVFVEAYGDKKLCANIKNS